MIRVTDKSKCCGCSACANACPKACIAMIPDEKGFLYPSVEEKACVHCGLCDKVCPLLHPRSCAGEKSAFAAYYKNDAIRKISSSGGLFGCVANEILNLNGVVFGAAFSEDFKTVKHVGIENKEDLPKLYGSKYLQSEIGDSYKSAERYLKAGREVLFVGTACQIAGLKSYLNKDYGNLLTMDVICHGTPSPLIWRAYVTEKENAHQSKVIAAEFRNKRFGWNKSVLLFVFADGTEYCALGSEDEYIQGFLANLYLRESCYTCSCKGENVLSDISLGDFWGIENVLPDFSDNNGASAIILNTAKGQAFFDRIRLDLVTELVSYGDIARGNPALVAPVAKPRKSHTFWDIYHTRGLKRAHKKCLRASFFSRSYHFVRRIGSKVKKTIESR